MVLCVLPVFVYADGENPDTPTPAEGTGTASIRVNVTLTTGTHDGSFTFTVREKVAYEETDEVTGETTIKYRYDVIDSQPINARQGIGSYTFSNLKPNTEYQIVEGTLGNEHEFVSLESGIKIVTNTQTIYVTTGEADSVTIVTATNTSAGGIETNKETNPIKDPITRIETGKSTLSLSVTGKANTTVSTSGANVLIIYDTSGSMKEKYRQPINTFVKDPDTGIYADKNGNHLVANSSSKHYYAYNEGEYIRLYWRCTTSGSQTECRFRKSNSDTGTIYDYDGTLYNFDPQTGNYWGFSEGEYKKLYWVCTYPNAKPPSGCGMRFAYGSSNPYFTGTIVEESDLIRAISAEKVVYDFASRLFAKNANLAFITFSNEAEERVDWTKESSDMLSLFTAPGTGYTSSWYVATVEGKMTNWEAAFQQAQTTLNKLNNNDPTYVVFITDGQPTKSVTHGTNGDLLTFYDDTRDEIEVMNGIVSAGDDEVVNKKADQIYGIYAFGYQNNVLDDLIYYSNKCHDGTCEEMPYTGNTELEGRSKTEESTENYYTALHADALNDAIDEIFNLIVSTIGFSNVHVEDGTTSQVKVSSSNDAARLLEVNPESSSFVYWLSMPIVLNTETGKYQLTRKNRTTGLDETITFTPESDGEHIIATWGDNTYNLEGTITPGSNNTGTIKYRWKTDDTKSFYDFDNPGQDPPTAEYISDKRSPKFGTIEWDLSNLGTGDDEVNRGKLINDVTYTVDVEVWPSQYTQDLIADLMNNPDKYETLEDNIKDYIVYDKTTNTYSLRTNTKALVEYRDSNNNSGTTKMTEPTPIGTQQEEVTITKEWPEGYNTLDIDDFNKEYYEEQGGIELYLQRGEEILEDTIKINPKNGWTANVFLSMGIIEYEYQKDTDGSLIIGTDGKPIVKAIKIVENGQDYTFKEKYYYWNIILDKEIVHPMLIFGNPTMLLKTDKSPSDLGFGMLDLYKEVDDITYWKINGVIYKVLTGSNANQITASNYRRSNLTIKKEVIGDYAGNALFTFNVTATSTEDLWFALFKPNPAFNPNIPENDKTNPKMVLVPTSVANGLISDLKDGDSGFVTPEFKNGAFTGYYSIPSGKIATITIYEDWVIKYINIPIDTQFTVVEGDMPNADFVFENITLNEAATAALTVSNKTVTGQLDENNKAYQITYKNRYLLTDVTVTKKWVKNDTVTTDNLPDNISVKIVPSNNIVISEDDKLKDGKLNEQPLEVELSATGTTPWSHTWSNLVKYRWNGNSYDEITYTVVETKINGKKIPNDKKYPVRDRYKAIIGRWLAGDPVGTDTDSGKSYTISNTWLEAPKTDLNFAKIDFITDLTNINTSDALSNVPTLEGAIFNLYRYQHDTASAGEMVYGESNDWKLVYTSEGNGRFVIPNLYAGEYRLVEVQTPDGYILPGGQWKIVITEAGDTVTVSTPTSIEHATAVTYKEADDTYYVYNEQVPEMPSTGARGIIDFSLIGLILMTLGSFFLIMNQKEKI